MQRSGKLIGTRFNGDLVNIISTCGIARRIQRRLDNMISTHVPYLGRAHDQFGISVAAAGITGVCGSCRTDGRKR